MTIEERQSIDVKEDKKDCGSHEPMVDGLYITLLGCKIKEKKREKVPEAHFYFTTQQSDIKSTDYCFVAATLFLVFLPWL